MNGRGMKKWAPYKSLIEQETFINNMRINKAKIDKPILCNEEIEKINFHLVNNKNQTLLYSIYQDGFIYKFDSKIKTIDLYSRKIVFDNNFNCLIEDIVDIEQI
jgi:hypothetical protein